MIAFSSVFRVDRVLRSLTPYLKARPFSDSQGQRFRYSLSCSSSMDGGWKRKTDVRVWRPVSIQASSNQEDITVVTEDGSRIEEVHCSKSSSIHNKEEVVMITEAANESVISSSTLEDDVRVGVLKAETMLSAEKHLVSVDVGASLFRFIKGKGGSTQKNIEEQMGVRIIFPSSKREESVTIEGSSVDSVTRASEKIQSIIDEAVKSPNLQFSHFISLPLAIHVELVDKLMSFQNSILGNSDELPEENLESDPDEGDSDGDEEKQLNEGRDVALKFKVEDEKHVKVDLTSPPLVSYAAKASKPPSLSDMGIDKSIFIKPKRFHLTLLMLKLWNKERVNAASEVLKSISPMVMDALDNQPVSIRLKGLDCMRGSMAKARVLYATVEEIGNEARLLRAAQVITDAFVEAGLVLDKDAKQKLKLHATVMNTSHRKGKRRRKSDSFDARGIFKQFGSEEWGEYLIREAHLSQRFVYDENGYYHCCASIPFPESMQVD